LRGRREVASQGVRRTDKREAARGGTAIVTLVATASNENAAIGEERAGVFVPAMRHRPRRPKSASRRVIQFDRRVELNG
jgi:hypothetical protein